MDTFSQLQNNVSDSILTLTTKRVNGEMDPMKNNNVITEQYQLHKDEADKIAEQLIKSKSPDAFYVYGEYKDLELDYGITDLDGFKISFVRYINKETGECSEPVAAQYDMGPSNDTQLFTLLIVLYAIAQKIHYQAVIDKIINLTGPELLYMNLIMLNPEE